MVTVTLDTSGEDRQWVIAIEDHPAWTGHGPRFRRALLKLMTVMEADGWFLLCNYARVDVASFNIMEVRRGGRYGWVLSLTKRFDSEHDEQVPLLDPLDRALTPATSAEKDAFWEKWLEFNEIRVINPPNV